MKEKKKDNRGGLRSTSFKPKSENGASVTTQMRLKFEARVKLEELSKVRNQTLTAIVEDLIMKEKI